MPLYQMLRILDYKTPIIFLDLEGGLIDTYNNVEDIPFSMYEERIVKMKVAWFDKNYNQPCLYIVLEK